MKIDSASPEHAYVQLAAPLRQRILSGEITSKLPSLTELTAETHLAVGTVRRAIDVLARECPRTCDDRAIPSMRT